MLKARAIKAGWSDSAVGAGTYVMTMGTVATPTFTPAPGSYAGTQNVAISCATSGATIRYTRDGSNPTFTSPIYTAPLVVCRVHDRQGARLQARLAPECDRQRQLHDRQRRCSRSSDARPRERPLREWAARDGDESDGGCDDSLHDERHRPDGHRPDHRVRRHRPGRALDEVQGSSLEGRASAERRGVRRLRNRGSRRRRGQARRGPACGRDRRRLGPELLRPGRRRHEDRSSLAGERDGRSRRRDRGRRR